MKRILPHLVALLVFLVLTFAYLYPVLQGKTICGSDTQSFLGMSKEASDYNKTHSDQALWTDAMFGGMPTYQICMDQPATLVKYLDTCLRVLPGPTYRVFLYLVGFYLMLLAFGVSPYLAIGGAIAFAFGSYNLIIIVAGHNTKAVAIAYMAPILGAIVYGFRKQRWVGAVLLALFLGMGLYANHVQIIYYTLFMVLCFGISELVISLRQHQVVKWLATVGALSLGSVLAVGMNATRLMTTAEYVKATMRGDSNGLSNPDDQKNGLDPDYITAWSYGKGESLTLLIPNYSGGSSVGTLDEGSETGRAIAQLSGYKPLGRNLTSAEKSALQRRQNSSNFQPRNLAELMYTFNVPLYWGAQPFTSGPVYVGAIICFLFVLGLIVVPGRNKWWLLGAALLGLLLSWGKNLMPLTDFFINYVPMYNKFRTVSMTLTITCLAMCIMAMLALKAFLSDELDSKQKLKALYISAGITGGICFLFAVLPQLAGNFISPADARFSGQYAFLQESLPIDRQSLLRQDALRSLLFIVLAALCLFAYAKSYIKERYAAIIVAVLFACDMLPVAHRYLNQSHFVAKKQFEVPYLPTTADKAVMADSEPGYRVLNLTVDIFNSSQPSYFYKTVGGYSAVKLRRYQELIDYRLAGEIQSLGAQLQNARSELDIQRAFAQMPVLNMLNTRYLIYHPEAAPLRNMAAYGSAWLVDSVCAVGSADAELEALAVADLRHQVVLDSTRQNLPAAHTYASEQGSLALSSYTPNELHYSFKSAVPQLAVFSEVFYYTGWKAYADGKELPIKRVNYLLRGLELPAGQYDIQFVFRPDSYRLGNILSIISSILLTLAFAYIIFAALKNRPRKG